MNKRIIDFTNEFNCLNNGIDRTTQKENKIGSEIHNTHQEINDLISEVNDFVSINNIPIETISPNDNNEVILAKLNTSFHNKIRDCVENVDTLPDMSSLDVIICCVAGLIATLMDMLLIGKPKIEYPKKFSGSILTDLLRRIDGNSGVFKYFSEKCKVPYDLPAMSDVVYPKNHRLRSLAHDPLFGLIFAVIDIMLGTTTCKDNNGFIQIIPTKKVSMKDKLFSVLLYLGHLISDVCTSCGLPIPGSFLTQINFENEFLQKISNVSETMYLNGYDCRHLISMSSSVCVSHFIVDMYLKLTQDEPSNDILMCEKELHILNNNLKKNELNLLSDAIGSLGNAIKIILPPDSGNLTAINIVQWFSLANSVIICFQTYMRDKNGEIVMANREVINKNWENRLEE